MAGTPTGSEGTTEKDAPQGNPPSLRDLRRPITVEHYEKMIDAGVPGTQDHLILRNCELVAEMTKRRAHVIAQECARRARRPQGWVDRRRRDPSSSLIPSGADPLVRFHRTTLPNGLQVIAELNDRAYSVASGFFVKTGSRDEPDELAGVSHFLEHMIFKGTERRDALAVNRDLDRVGAKHNAQTSEEDTVYHVTCLPEYLDGAFEVLADILRPSLRAEDFETEKKVIVEEIKMYQDNPMMVAYEAAKELHFAPHPLGHSVLGTVESIEGLEVDRMRGYFADRYGPSNIVLAVAGKTEWDHVVALADRFCGGWTGGRAGRAVAPARGTAAFKALLREDDNQMTILGVADAPPLESSDRYAAGLLATILGDHTGSRLYWALIDPGHADGIELSYQDYNGAGAFYTFLSCDPEEAQVNLGRIAGTLRQVMAEGVTEQELTQAKNKVLARTVLRSERPMGRLMALGYHWSYRGEYVPVEQELEEYSRVTPGDIRGILNRWPLLPMTTVSVGPTTEIHPAE
jgi:predicted Zn-dependent peptidase